MAFTSVSLHRSTLPSALLAARRGKECEPRVLRANSAGFRTVSISQTNRGHLRGLAYQVARNSLVLTRPWRSGISQRSVGSAKSMRLCLSRSCRRSRTEYFSPPPKLHRSSICNGNFFSRITNCSRFLKIHRRKYLLCKNKLCGKQDLIKQKLHICSRYKFCGVKYVT